jgi:hypothetical protein
MTVDWHTSASHIIPEKPNEPQPRCSQEQDGNTDSGEGTVIIPCPHVRIKITNAGIHFSVGKIVEVRLW